jgi:hypothetical protein
MAQSGDAIHVTGRYTQPGQVLARKIEIDMAPRRPLPDPKDRGPKYRTGRRRTEPDRRPETEPDGGRQPVKPKVDR